MIKVLTIWGSYLSNSIGPSQTLKRMIRNNQVFAKNDIKYSVLSLDNNEVVNPSAQKNNFKSIQKNPIIRYLVRNTLLFAFLSIYFKDVRHSLSILNKLKRINANSPDIIVFHDPITYRVCKKFISKFDAKVILFHHGGNIEDNMLFDYYPILYKRSWVRCRIDMISEQNLNMPDNIIFINSESYSNAQKKYKARKDKYKLILNGIEDLQTSNSSEYRSSRKNVSNLISIGTVNDRKNHILILKSLKRSKQKLKNNVHLTIAGDGPALAQLMDYSNQNDLDDYLTFLGNVEDVIPLLKKADIFIMSSNNEGLPISLLEALSFGLPIISSNISGARECVSDGINGILFEANNEYALSEIFERMQEINWGEYGRQSRALYETKFTFEKMQNAYIKLIKELYRN